MILGLIDREKNLVDARPFLFLIKKNFGVINSFFRVFLVLFHAKSVARPAALWGSQGEKRPAAMDCTSKKPGGSPGVFPDFPFFTPKKKDKPPGG